MNPKPLFPLMLLLVMPASLLARADDPLMRKGEDALASGLWEMAALHFNDCLANKNLPPADKARVALRLAEAWIRGGKPAEALSLLGQSFVSQDPETPFWKGQALAGLGRFSDSINTLTPLLADPKAPHRGEAGFTVASLHMALGQADPALTALATLARGADDNLAVKTRLEQVEILLGLGRVADARQAMPAPSSIGPDDRMAAMFLEAHLLLAEGHPADAVTGFQTLIDQPSGQSLYRYHAAAVGLADALIAAGFRETATGFLLSFIQDHPTSPLLDAMFRRLLDGLPDAPTPTDPILERLARWITPSEIPTTGAINTLECCAATAWPIPTTTNNLLANALYTRAAGLHRVRTPNARAESKRLLTRLRLENPNHPLAAKALFLTANWALEDGATERALTILDTLRESSAAPALRGEAAFLEARTSALRGDRSPAIRLFEEAAKSLTETDAKTARLNAILLKLTGSSGTSTPVIQSDRPPDAALAADLELERALSSATPAAAKSAISEFLTRHPDHPRVPEARLAAAEAALAPPSPDPAFARTQLEILTASPESSASLSAPRIALLNLHLADLTKDTAAAIAAARSFLTQFPDDPAAPEAALVLGRNLFQTRNYNDARLVLEKLALSDPDPARAQAAGLLAARSAALVPTSQSHQEALLLFDKVIQSKGNLAAIAMLEKARLMIDMNRLAEASAFLRKWFDSLPKSDPLHLPAGLLLGEAIYAQGSINPNSLTEALAVYDQLLTHADKQPAVFNRLQYLRGRTLEQIPDDKDPAKKRDKQAFIAYYSVLETTTPPAEWHYFELCGFRALALLEKAERWPAAVACAKKIASFKGPRSQEAANRASQLQLKYFIWED